MSIPKPDQASLAFITWANQKLQEPGVLDDLVTRISEEATVYYLGSPEQIRSDVVRKLWKGSIEHGPPWHELPWIQKEMRAELIDLLGYMLLYWYNQEQKEGDG